MKARNTNLLFFYFYLSLAAIFALSQMAHMVTDSTEGLSLSMFIFAFLYVSVNSTLAIGAHKTQASEITKQLVIVMIIGVAIYFLFSLILAVKAEVAWDKNDTITTIIVLALSLVNLAYSYFKGLEFFDPVVKGNYSLIFKSVPQLFLAYKISQYGGSGLSVVMIFTFHALTLVRIFQIFQSITEAGWDRNRIGLIVSEIGNEISWTIVTIVKFV